MIKKLMTIQKELKAPKNQFNSFGKYKYRSCEDILEAVKPLLAKNGCVLTLSDEVVEIGSRVYVKATATITDGTTPYTVTAFAREEADKKGMDGSQITGTASSYARKYALNGLFCIDDTKDADTDEHTKQTTKKEKEKPETAKEKEKPETAKETYREKIYKYVEENGLDMKEFAAEHKLSRTTTEDEFKALYEKLGGK